MVTIYIANEKRAVTPLYEVDLVKYDAADSRQTLSGAVFDLYCYDEGTARYEMHTAGLFTDGEGCIHVENLALGRYKFVEITPPAGYRLNDNCDVFFEVQADSAGGRIGLTTLSVTNRQAEAPEEETPAEGPQGCWRLCCHPCCTWCRDCCGNCRPCYSYRYEWQWVPGCTGKPYPWGSYCPWPQANVSTRGYWWYQ